MPPTLSAAAVAAVPAPPVPAPAPPNQEAGGPLAQEHMVALEDARRAARPIRRAAGVASCSGWSMAFFAGISIVCGLFSLSTLIVGLGLGVVAFVELRGARRLRGFDPGAPRLLALNQVGVALVLCLYGGWGLFNAITGPSHYAEQMAMGGAVADTLAPIDDLMRTVHVLTYAAVIGFSLVAQGAMSLYYLSRRGRVVAYRRHTPQWVLETQRLTSG